MPRKRVLGDDYVVLEAPGKNYTISMLGEMLLDQGMGTQASLLEEIQGIDAWTHWQKGEGPGVKALCL